MRALTWLPYRAAPLLGFWWNSLTFKGERGYESYSEVRSKAFMDPSDPQGRYRGNGFASSKMLFELRGRRVRCKAHLHDRRNVVCIDLVQQLSATCDACILLATLRTSETFCIDTQVSKFAEARIVLCCVWLLHNLDYLRPLLQPHGYTAKSGSMLYKFG